MKDFFLDIYRRLRGIFISIYERKANQGFFIYVKKILNSNLGPDGFEFCLNRSIPKGANGQA